MEIRDMEKRLSELQATMDIYTRRIDGWEQEVNHLKDTQHDIALDIRTYSTALTNLQNEVSTSRDRINELHDQSINLRMNLAEQSVDMQSKITDIGTLHGDINTINEKLETHDHQVMALVNRTKLLQQSIADLNNAIKKIDGITTQNDVLIGKLDFTIKVVIGLISGAVAVLGAITAGWEWLSTFFSK